MSWDYIIVGGGSAGCVLAGRLSEDPSVRTLLLEAGPRDWSPLIYVPAGAVAMHDKLSIYADEPDPLRNGQTMRWVAPRILGGGSSVNGMVWVRGNAADYDEWASLGCDGWDYDHVLPYFKRAERYRGGADSFRGDSGPQRVTEQVVRHPLNDAFLAAAEAAGHARNSDYNGASQLGVGVCQVAQRRGIRHSEARAYLGPARFRRNLTVRTGSLARRIVFDGTRAIGVEYERKGRRIVDYARREVVLSAGTLASPKLLMCSGVGPRDQLQEHGVSLVAALPGVGTNLQEHPMIPMVWNVDVPTINMELTIRGFLRHGLAYVLRGTGPAAAGVCHVLLFMNPTADGARPTVEAGFAPLGLVGSDAGDTSKEVLDGAGQHDVENMHLMKRPTVTVVVQMVRPSSRGRVELRSADPTEAPRIRHSLFSSDEDLKALIAGCRSVREVMANEPFARHVMSEALPGDRVQSDAEWEAFLRVAAWGAMHPVGTCRMGTDDDAVVDPELRVRGVQGLRVVDASVMPTIPSGNTNAPTVMIAEKAADLIRAASPKQWPEATPSSLS